MAQGTFSFFNFVIMIQLFYGFGFTMLTYALVPFSVDQTLLTQFSVPGQDAPNISSTIEDSTNSQIDIPLIDLGALVFYSGNLILDLMLNFFTAIPSMFTLLIEGFSLFFNVDAQLLTQLKLFVGSLISVLYLLNVMGWLTNVRSRGSVV